MTYPSGGNHRNESFSVDASPRKQGIAIDVALHYRVFSHMQRSNGGSQMSTTISLPETNSSSLKMNGWKTILSLWGPAYFQRWTVSFRECKNHVGVVIHHEFTGCLSHDRQHQSAWISRKSPVAQSNLHQALKKTCPQIRLWKFGELSPTSNPKPLYI